MRETELYARILDIQAPWQVTSVKLQLDQGKVVIDVEYDPDASLVCPRCGRTARRYDTRRRRWRHLDTCQYQTLLDAGVPRVECTEHGVQTMGVPWAEGSSRLTALFEALAIDWMREASISAVAERLRISWDQAAGIMERAVQRGLVRREVALPKTLAVDETSFQRRHEYVTVVHDPSAPNKRVLHVSDGRGKEALGGFLGGFRKEEREAVEVVVMDMHEPFISAVREVVDGPEQAASGGDLADEHPRPAGERAPRTRRQAGAPRGGGESDLRDPGRAARPLHLADPRGLVLRLQVSRSRRPGAADAR